MNPGRRKRKRALLFLALVYASSWFTRGLWLRFCLCLCLRRTCKPVLREGWVDTSPETWIDPFLLSGFSMPTLLTQRYQSAALRNLRKHFCLKLKKKKSCALVIVFISSALQAAGIVLVKRCAGLDYGRFWSSMSKESPHSEKRSTMRENGRMAVGIYIFFFTLLTPL